MINILLSKYDIGKKWCVKAFKKYINKNSRIAVIAFSFGKEINGEQEWDKFYGVDGVLSNAIVKSFKHYGISRENIECVNYYRDTPETAKRKLANADILYFPGGDASRIMSRVIEFDLYNDIENHNGVVIGFGAGAQVQLAKYPVINRDEWNRADAGGGHARWAYGLGFRFAEGFHVEPNYVNDESQNYFIRRIVCETGSPMYAIGEEGAIIVDNGYMNVVGDVQCFRKRETA